MMVDDHVERVCCMCGDVGFPDKIFRCINCHHRFQHSYCSNYYSSQSSSQPPERCDWCQSEVMGATKAGPNLKKSTSKTNRSEYSGSKMIKPWSSGAPSPKAPTRKYKLLKDVMC